MPFNTFRRYRFIVADNNDDNDTDDDEDNDNDDDGDNADDQDADDSQKAGALLVEYQTKTKTRFLLMIRL